MFDSFEHLPLVYKSESCQYLGVSILDQSVVELNGLYKVFNGDSFVEPMEPFRITLCDKCRGKPGN